MCGARTCASRSTVVFFFNDTAPTEIYTLSLHDALPILVFSLMMSKLLYRIRSAVLRLPPLITDRKSTRLNSSHHFISYDVFCLIKYDACTAGRPDLGQYLPSDGRARVAQPR